MQGLIEATKRGTRMTKKRKILLLKIFSVIPAGTSIPRSLVALGKFNYVLLLKQFGFAIKRDAAIKMGEVGSTTLLFKHDIFVMPGAEHHPMVKEAPVSELLIEKLKPQNEHYTL